MLAFSPSFVDWLSDDSDPMGVFTRNYLAKVDAIFNSESKRSLGAADKNVCSTFAYLGLPPFAERLMKYQFSSLCELLSQYLVVGFGKASWADFVQNFVYGPPAVRDEMVADAGLTLGSEAKQNHWVTANNITLGMLSGALLSADLNEVNHYKAVNSAGEVAEAAILPAVFSSDPSLPIFAQSTLAANLDRVEYFYRPDDPLSDQFQSMLMEKNLASGVLDELARAVPFAHHRRYRRGLSSGRGSGSGSGSGSARDLGTTSTTSGTTSGTTGGGEFVAWLNSSGWADKIRMTPTDLLALRTTGKTGARPGARPGASFGASTGATGATGGTGTSKSTRLEMTAPLGKRGWKTASVSGVHPVVSRHVSPPPPFPPPPSSFSEILPTSHCSVLFALE
jgi:hypothetical protein